MLHHTRNQREKEPATTTATAGVFFLIGRGFLVGGGAASEDELVSARLRLTQGGGVSPPDSLTTLYSSY